MTNRLPSWLKRTIPPAGAKSRVAAQLSMQGLSTVCEEARCPNRSECYCDGTATFLLMGDRCTRSCRFCAVSKAAPQPLPADEAERILEAVKALGLRYVVLTSVTRDDLFDGGASHFAGVVRTLKQALPKLGVEVLVPDFNGDPAAQQTIFDSPVDCFNHNVEMVPRLYAALRPEAGYEQSLTLLRRAKAALTIPVKSGIMVGLGERDEEVYALIDALARCSVDILTIGQYLQPSSEQVAVARYVEPALFERYKEYALGAGIGHVEAGPFIRSSYKAAKSVEIVLK